MVLRRYASEFFPLLAPILSELGNRLDTIHWISRFDPNDGQLVGRDIENGLFKQRVFISFHNFSICQVLHDFAMMIFKAFEFMKCDIDMEVFVVL